MRQQSDKLTEEFHTTNRHLKQEMLKAGIRRPNRRVMLFCFFCAGILGAACVVESFRGHDFASNVLLALSMLAAVSMVLVQMSPRLAESIKTKRKNSGRDN